MVPPEHFPSGALRKFTCHHIAHATAPGSRAPLVLTTDTPQVHLHKNTPNDKHRTLCSQGKPEKKKSASSAKTHFTCLEDTRALHYSQIERSRTTPKNSSTYAHTRKNHCTPKLHLHASGTHTASRSQRKDYSIPKHAKCVRRSKTLKLQ